MNPSPSLHARIAAAFDDQEVRTLCFDRFPAVEREFTTGMTTGQMIGLLLDYCVRRQAGEALLDALEQERPGLIGADRDALLAWLNSARFDSGSGTTPGQTIVIAGDQHNVDTGGGDYAGHDIDKRQGAFVSGGTVQGNVVGTNLGTVTANYYSQQATPITPALHQLRAPVGDFVGREREIAELIQAARSSTVAAISGVRGMGGIGKTELAYVVAHELVSDFPDAQIMVELRGASDPLTPVQALQTVIRAFEREARLPDDVVELQGLYRSLLSGRRVLILADDARDAAQVRPLLPPSGCALLATSRYRFTLPGMLAIDLGTLAPTEAEAMLLTICPRIGEAAATLARLCGYLPLALRVSASLLASDVTLPVARYLELLADERTRLAALHDGEDPALNVDASLALSYAALDSAAQAALCQLSVFVADFNLAAAQAVVILEKGQIVDGLLGDLYRRSLIDYDAVQERYSLHDLARVFAHTRLDALVSEAVMLRYARHYVQVADRADDLYLEGGESLLAGLALFDRERAHIDAGWAFLLGQIAGLASDELLIRYADATAHIGDIRYDVRRERIPQLRAALVAAQRGKHHAAQSMALNNLGLAYVDLGEVRLAIDSYQEDLTITREVGDRLGEGQTLNNLGLAYEDLGELQLAIDSFEQSLEIRREVGDRRGEGQTLNNLGLAYADLGEVWQAIEYYGQSLEIKRAVGDRLGESHTLGNLGNAYASLGRLRLAIDYYEQVFAITREVGDRLGESLTLNNLGLAYEDLGELWLAIDSFEQSLEIAREVGDQQGEARGNWNLGVLLAKQGELAQAIALMQLCVDYEQSIDRTEAERHAALVEVLRAQHQAAVGTVPPDAAAPPEGDAPAEEPLA